MMLSAVAFVRASEIAMASFLPVLLKGRNSWRLLPCIPALALYPAHAHDYAWPSLHHMTFASCHCALTRTKQRSVSQQLSVPGFISGACWTPTVALPWTYLCPFAAVILLQICMLLPDGTKTSIWRGTTAPQGTLKSPYQHTGPVSFKSFGPLTPRRRRFKRKGVKAEERAASTAGAQSQIVKVG